MSAIGFCHFTCTHQGWQRTGDVMAWAEQEGPVGKCTVRRSQALPCGHLVNS